jgi:hypothetical protein
MVFLLNGPAYCLKMKNILFRIVIALFIVFSVGYINQEQTQAVSPAIDTVRTYTFEELGYPEIRLTQDKLEKQTYKFFLPSEAKQGPEKWYLVHLNLHIDFSPDCGDGYFYMYVDTNNYCCALFEFRTERLNDVLVIKWSSADLVNGYYENSLLSLSENITFSNYLSPKGVRGGENDLIVRAETIGDTRINNVLLYGSSSLECTTVAPPKLTLDVLVPEENVVVGQEFKIQYTLNNTGSLPAENVTLAIQYPEQVLDMKTDNLVFFPKIESSQTGEFVMKPLDPGEYEIKVAVVGVKGGVNKPWDSYRLTGEVRNFPFAKYILVILLGSFFIGFLVYRGFKIRSAKTRR